MDSGDWVGGNCCERLKGDHDENMVKVVVIDEDRFSVKSNRNWGLIPRSTRIQPLILATPSSTDPITSRTTSFKDKHNHRSIQQSHCDLKYRYSVIGISIRNITSYLTFFEISPMALYSS